MGASSGIGHNAVFLTPCFEADDFDVLADWHEIELEVDDLGALAG